MMDREDSPSQCGGGRVRWTWREVQKGDEEEGVGKGASGMFHWPRRMNERWLVCSAKEHVAEDQR